VDQYVVKQKQALSSFHGLLFMLIQNNGISRFSKGEKQKDTWSPCMSSVAHIFRKFGVDDFYQICLAIPSFNHVEPK
jgi:hypothetical protein